MKAPDTPDELLRRFEERQRENAARVAEAAERRRALAIQAAERESREDAKAHPGTYL